MELGLETWSYLGTNAHRLKGLRGKGLPMLWAGEECWSRGHTQPHVQGQGFFRLPIKGHLAASQEGSPQKL